MRSSPASTAFFASSPAPIITDGFDVLVQLVIAAITTDPCPKPFSVSALRSRLVPCAPAGARACFGGSPPASTVGGSLAGKLSADDLSQPW